MADVACFCGCFYSFDGAGGACPKCGEYASVAAEPTPEGAVRSGQNNSVVVTSGAGQDGQAWRMTFPEWVEAGAIALSRVTVGAGARGPAAGQEQH